MSLDDLHNDKPFHYRASKDGLVQIFYRQKMVTTVNGRDAVKLLSKLESASEENAQLLMAKATGHFKHGNERASKTRRS
ncbi:MAG: hypothetical protein AAGI44_10880 [Pseudomonadota bacterium]